jgi:hypothetical protein
MRLVVRILYSLCPHSGPRRAKRARKYWQPAKGSAGISRAGPLAGCGAAALGSLRPVRQCCRSGGRTPDAVQRRPPSRQRWSWPSRSKRRRVNSARGSTRPFAPGTSAIIDPLRERGRRSCHASRASDSTRAARSLYSKHEQHVARPPRDAAVSRVHEQQSAGDDRTGTIHAAAVRLKTATRTRISLGRGLENLRSLVDLPLSAITGLGDPGQRAIVRSTRVAAVASRSRSRHAAIRRSNLRRPGGKAG